ncbi:MAG: glycoside hydrolase family 3 N-terminal domain-containing protein [Acidimicrobiales bacterium]
MANDASAPWARLARRRRRRRGEAAGALTIVLFAAVLYGCGSPAANPGTVGTAPTTTTAPASTTAVPKSSTTTASTTTLPARPTTAACKGGEDLATWSLHRLAEQTITVPVEERDVASITSQVAAGAGGVILFGSSAPVNLGTALRSLDASAPDGLAPFVMTDEEGGVVQRMANLVGSLPSARQMAAALTPVQIRQLAARLAVRMRAAGVTMDLAPVLDVDGGQGPNNLDPDGTRSFSANEETAATDGLAFAAGLRAGGVVPVVKHFPGLGGATGNTDVMPASTPPWNTLQKVGLVPFEDALDAHVAAVMIANASVPGLSTLPASISPEVITGLLRDQLGFQGLVITDSLSAVALRAVGYSVSAATVAALNAGADMVLFDAAQSDVAALTNQIVSAVVSAVGSGKLARSRLVSAVTHILAVKRVRVCPPG